MNRAKIIIPIIISIGIIWGFMYASGGGSSSPEPFPDTAEMPRVPTADGTIWGFLKWLLGLSSGNDVLHYAGSGGVEGARMLSGVTADKLLSASAPCSDPNQVVIWIENWALKCGTITRILAQLWTIESMSGTAKAYTYHASGSYEEITPSTLMYQGDVIHTEPWKSVTLAFLDKSILRIDEDTTVSLSIWNIPSTGQSLAYAILESGGLWWRVLTETGGYFIGNTDLVAWVRGTSVSLVTTGVNIAYSPIHPDGAGISWSGAVKRWEIAKTGTPTTTLAIVQSQESGKAATVTCKDGTTQTERDAFSGSVYRLSGSNCSALQSERFTTASGIYNSTYNIGNRFERNTLADLEYMSGIISSVSLTPTQKQKIVNEFEVTRPKSADDKTSLCDGGNYWEYLVGTSKNNPCRPSDLIAFADYTNSEGSLYTKDRKVWGMNITTPNQPNGTYEFAIPISGKWAVNVTMKDNSTHSVSSINNLLKINNDKIVINSNISWVFARCKWVLNNVQLWTFQSITLKHDAGKIMVNTGGTDTMLCQLSEPLSLEIIYLKGDVVGNEISDILVKK